MTTLPPSAAVRALVLGASGYVGSNLVPLLDLLEAHGTLFHWWECVPAYSWSTLPGMARELDRYLKEFPKGPEQREAERYRALAVNGVAEALGKRLRPTSK